MIMHGHYVEGVGYLARKANNGYYMFYRSDGNYYTEANGNIVALYHYDILILVWDKSTKEILTYNAATRTDRDAINTVIYSAPLDTYEGIKYNDMWVSICRDGTVILHKVN